MNDNPWIVALVRTCGPRLVAAAAAGFISAASALAVDEALVARYTPWFMPPEIWNPKLSPTGEYLGLQLRDGETYAVGIYDFAKRKLSVSSGSGKFYPVDYWWKGPRRLMVRVRKASDVRQHTVTAFDIDGTNPEELWNLNEHGGRIVDALPGERDQVLMAYSDEVARVNIRNGKWSTVAGNIGNMRRWFVDGNLAPRAAFSRDHLGRQVVWWKTVGGTKWRHLEFAPDERGFSPVAFDRDPRFLWVWDFRPYPHLRLSKFDTESGVAEPGFGESELQPTALLQFRRAELAVAAVYTQAGHEGMEALNGEMRGAVSHLAGAFAGHTCELVDSMPDGSAWIVHAESSRFPGGFFTFDPGSGAVGAIAASHSPTLKEDLFVSSQPVSVRSRSGGRIGGRLWMPRAGSPAPLVVLCPPHFPAAPAPERFDAFVQALCDQGFAVAQFDARGTFGYGFETELLATGDVAQTLREDYEDGVAGLAAQGHVDPKRAALMGMHMGGALAIAVGEGGGSFKAVIAVNPPRKIERDDLALMSADFSAIVISERLGGWRSSAEAARALSPILVAPRLKVPTLILLDEDESGLLSLDARALANAMRSAGIPGRNSRDAKSFDRAIKASGAPISLETAFKHHENLTPAGEFGRESATMAVKIGEFLKTAMAK